jgi:hypothetical protein
MTPRRGPIFLVGTGRCGSTILYSCLAMHRDFAWISSWLTLAPRWPVLTAVNRLWDTPGTARWREARFLPKPVEPNDVFRRWDPSYLEEGLTPERVARARVALIPLIERIRRYQGRARFLAKMVGRPVTVSLMRELFPDAFFIHIVRDLKPTTASLLRVDFYQRANFDRWPWGPIPTLYLEFYERRGKPAEVAAAIALRHSLEELQRQLARLPDGTWMELGYAAFVSDPAGALRQVAALAGFEADGKFLRDIGSRRVYGGADQNWRKYFDDSQIRNLDDFEALAASA